MRFYEELFKSADGGAFSRCIWVPRGGGYFQGVKAVEDFSSERIVICFPKDTVEVTGERLMIKKYCDGDLEISGRVLCVRALFAEDEGDISLRQGGK